MFPTVPPALAVSDTRPPALWAPVFAQLRVRLASGRARAAALAPPPPAAVAAALARAHSRLLVALDGRTRDPRQVVSELVEDAAQLIVAVAELRAAAGRSGEETRSQLLDQLQAHLFAHEDAVLAGEVTYELRLGDGEDPAVRMRRALAGTAGGEAISVVDLASLRIAAIELAALLVRAAVNVTISGSADHAKQTLPPTVDAGLRAITLELLTNASARERPVHPRGDTVAHHLAQGLRIPRANEILNELAHATEDAATRDAAALQNAKDVWVRLATHEYIAIAALDLELKTPAYRERFSSLEDGMHDAAANVLAGGRLPDRYAAFAHSRAWRHQMVGLSYALEAYIDGIRGHPPSLAQAQLIALTRLARSIAAIATLDQWQQAPTPRNGTARAGDGPIRRLSA